jgi:hypothetical protein
VVGIRRGMREGQRGLLDYLVGGGQAAFVGAEMFFPGRDAEVGVVVHDAGGDAPIVGATMPHHLTDAVAACDVTLTDDEIQMLEEPYTPQALLVRSF